MARRFLILTQYYPPEVGAAQVRLSAVARQLHAMGHTVEVVTAMPNYPTGTIQPGYRRRLWRRESIDGIPVTRVWLYASMGRGLRRLLSYLSFTLMSILGLARSRRPDYLFVESPPLFVVVSAALFARLWRAALIVNVSDLWPDAAVDLGVIPDGAALRLARRLERWCYSRATVINSVTEGIRAVIAAGRAPAAKLRMLPNGVDLEAFRPDGGDATRLAALGLESDALFVYTGNLGYAQGLDSIVRAAQLASQRRAGIVVAFIGDGSDRRSLEALAADIGASNVRFVPPLPLHHVADVLPLTAGVIVSLRRLPTNEGARPSKIFPALASGRPILYAAEGEGADLVAGAEAGIVVANDDVLRIAEAMVRLADDRAEGDRLGANGRALAQARFSWDALVTQWLSTLP